MDFTEKETRVLKIAMSQYKEGLEDVIFNCDNPFLKGQKQDKKDLATVKRIIKKLRSCNER